MLEKLLNRLLIFRYHRPSQSRNELYQEQERVFQKTKKILKNTEVFHQLGLAHLHSYQDFIHHVPAHDYEFFRPLIERQLSGEKNIMFKGRPLVVALTSGTTGDSKKIPHTKESLGLFLNVQKQMISAFLSQYLDKNLGKNNVASNSNQEIKEKKFSLLSMKRIAIGSIPEVYQKEGIRYGYMSGILNDYAPKLVQRNLFPSQKTLMISDWDKKRQAILAETLHQDIQLISGIPSYVLSFFEYVQSTTGVKTLDEIWPNLSTYVYGAIAIDHFRERLDSFFLKPLNYLGTYLASEGAFGFSVEESSKNLENQDFKNTDSISYVFACGNLLTFTDILEEKKQVGLHELQVGKDYYLNITMPNGMINYQMKDCLHILQVEGQVRFQIKGRKSTGVNYTGERSSDFQISQAALLVQKKYELPLRHYMVFPKVEGKIVYYQWIFFLDNHYVDANLSLGEALDLALQKENELYQYARHDGIFHQARCTVVSAQYIEEYFLENQMKGQLKIKTSFQSEEDFQLLMQNSSLEKLPVNFKSSHYS